jgi:hypothetical protein
MTAKKNVRLNAEEVQTLQLVRRNMPSVVKNLIMIAQSDPNPTKRIQAAEILLKYGLADRNLQMLADGSIGGANDKNGAGLNITINKIDARLLDIMEQIPPQLKMEFAIVMDKIEKYASSNEIEIFDGDKIIEDKPNLCACGCGTPVKNKFVKGHHFKRDSQSPKQIRARELGPKEIADRKAKLMALGMTSEQAIKEILGE